MKFTKNNLILLIILFCSNNLFSQNIITGNIKGIDGKNIPNANLILKTIENETIAYCTTDDDGNFILNLNRAGVFILKSSTISYKSKEVEITIEKNSKNNINFILEEKVEQLEEVFIEADQPITVKKDTIIFSADSFKQGNEQVVEDLLKKIPGLNIDASGTIKIGNQEVEKVMIDGDDMFAKGYKILTKNMPANPIDKIELYQNYSNNKHLKSIENTEKVALNLTLKEDSKRVWFGNIQSGYGLISENQYEITGNLMNFGKKNKYYFLSNLNNIGLDATGDINHLIRPYSSDEPSNLGDDQTASTLLSIGNATANLKKKRVNFNNSEILSLNCIFKLSEKIRLKTLGFLNLDENSFFNNNFQQFSLGNNTFTNTENYIGRKTQVIGFGKIDLEYDITKNKMLEYTLKLNQTNENNRSNLLFNNEFLLEKINTKNQLFDQKIVFTNKYKDNKVFLLSGRYINEKSPQNYSVNQFIFQDLFSDSANNTKQFSENKMQVLGFEALLLNKNKVGNLLELKIGNQLRIDDLDTHFELLENQNSLSFPVGYQNNLTYKTNDLYLSSKYHFKVKKITILTQLDFHQLFNQLENYSTKTNQNSFFLVPKIGLDWKINEKNKITTTYSYNTTNTGIVDVYSGYVQTGFRSFSKGLDTFTQLNESNAILNYSYGGWSDKFFSNTFIVFTKSNDFFSTNSMISQNFSQSEKIIIKDREILTISSSLERYFKFLKSNLKIKLGTTKTNFKNSVNNSDLREVKSINTDYGFELRSGFKGVFNYHIGSKWNYNSVKTTIKNSFTDNLTFLDLSFIPNKAVSLDLKSERYFFGNLEKSNNKYYFLDLESKYVIKENKLTFFLSGNNLFNTKTFKNYSISDINISKSEYRLLPRYFLIKMEYRF